MARLLASSVCPSDASRRVAVGMVLRSFGLEKFNSCTQFGIPMEDTHTGEAGYATTDPYVGEGFTFFG